VAPFKEHVYATPIKTKHHIAGEDAHA